MKKWFQVYVEADDDPDSDSVPMRMDPDTIQGFVKYTNYITLVYTPYGQFKVHEEYEKFAKRLFVFVNFEALENTNQPQSEEVETTTTRKRYIVKVKKEQQKDLETLQDYYDNHQPDTNSGKYI
jgi:hypothetical protein